MKREWFSPATLSRAWPTRAEEGERRDVDLKRQVTAGKRLPAITGVDKLIASDVLGTIRNLRR